uniref:Uncharacterized protein n=1 Tax=Lepeophtheirus salmonis TaxID=72036 RepID=A0A0K2UDV8_LEPSM
MILWSDEGSGRYFAFVVLLIKLDEAKTKSILEVLFPVLHEIFSFGEIFLNRSTIFISNINFFKIFKFRLLILFKSTFISPTIARGQGFPLWELIIA